LCNAIPNITIYTNEFSKEVILNKFENHYLVKNKQVHFYISILKAGIPQNIGSIVTIPFRVTSTFPQSLGFIFKINDENIIYIDDFIVSSNKNILFYNQMYFINALTGSKNTILLCNVGNVGNYTGFTSPKYQILAEIENIFLDSKGRIIFALYDEDIYRLVTILKITIESERPIYFLSDYTRNVAESIMKNNFSGSNLKFLELNEVIKSKNSVIVISSPIEDIFNDIISFFSE
jgi:ribonuclease J